ncbi:LapA family protein [Thermovirga sp.]|uniref:LapA family protein n=1 Tax=Thermovirga sp. TaxID=2699834 RepID=UPI0025D7DD8E|nr:LapA family protein [Thermovirga sp.]MBO8154156.1 LapA family protein [Thermovirga sp.]
MRSYALAIAVAMLVAALYAFQNPQEVVVKFFSWERELPQGIWEVLLFAAGGVLMWLVSLFALVESRAKLIKQIKEKDKKIKDLEAEKNSLIKAIGEKNEKVESETTYPSAAEEVKEIKTQPTEKTEKEGD